MKKILFVLSLNTMVHFFHGTLLLASVQYSVRGWQLLWRTLNSPGLWTWPPPCTGWAWSRGWSSCAPWRHWRAPRSAWGRGWSCWPARSEYTAWRFSSRLPSGTSSYCSAHTDMQWSRAWEVSEWLMKNVWLRDNDKRGQRATVHWGARFCSENHKLKAGAG